ncbi:hypothetical protein QBC46DRAFT_431460 [Diplogelasinospora grovesii]|uniref:Uncharacterized protein n=1 Tax=Diplogelasinospora grovesii TaxID=303347 RepID=A0AAN6RYG1_9PEZI|nr:hypothetical protein QBC46DRAFT_431460 [Diplogelasinospora grovesii]
MTCNLIPLREDEYFIVENDVIEAVKLRQHRQQPRFSRTEKSVVRFPVFSDGHSAAVEVVITPTPIPRAGSPNCFYEVTVRLWPCHDDNHPDPFYQQIQLVEICAPSPSPGSTCHHITKLTLDRLASIDSATGPARGSEGTIPSAVPLVSNPSRVPRKRPHDGDTGDTEGSTDDDHSVTGALVGKTAATDQGSDANRRTWDRHGPRSIADSIIRAVREGQRKSAVSKEIPGRSEIYDLLSQGLTDDVDKNVEKLGSVFATCRNNAGNQHARLSWLHWYFSGSFGYVGSLKRENKRHPWATGVRILNSIVNNMLATDGAVALAIFGALAEQNHTLYKAAVASLPDQEDIIRFVSNGLRGTLQSPPDEYTVPNAVAWVANVRNVSFRDACCDLNIPNLAPLHLQLELGSITNARQVESALRVKYSIVVEKWDSFQQGIEIHLQHLRDLYRWFDSDDLRDLDKGEALLVSGRLDELAGLDQLNQSLKLLGLRRLFGSGESSDEQSADQEMLQLLTDSRNLFSPSQFRGLDMIRSWLELRRLLRSGKKEEVLQQLRSNCLSGLLKAAKLRQVDTNLCAMFKTDNFRRQIFSLLQAMLLPLVTGMFSRLLEMWRESSTDERTSDADTYRDFGTTGMDTQSLGNEMDDRLQVTGNNQPNKRRRVGEYDANGNAATEGMNDGGLMANRSGFVAINMVQGINPTTLSAHASPSRDFLGLVMGDSPPVDGTGGSAGGLVGDANLPTSKESGDGLDGPAGHLSGGTADGNRQTSTDRSFGRSGDPGVMPVTMGQISLPDGSCLPIGYLEGQPPMNHPGDAAGRRGIGMGTDVARETMVSLEYHNPTAPVTSLYPLGMLLEAVGEATRLDQVAEEDHRLDIFMDEVLDLRHDELE